MGGLWSTFIVAARARALHAAFQRRLPRLAAHLSPEPETRGCLDGSRLRRAYARLPAADFSADLLVGLRDTAALVWPAALGWADLGTPERLLGWLDRERSARGASMPAFATATDAALTRAASRID
jgi:hypothetical protein